jgi:hypothetical protein
MTRPKVLAYYFPQYHPDARNDARFHPGWTEWELLRHAGPRFDGHAQPRVPARGEEDESDPAVMARYIDLARSHGIDGFVFDYYWYENRPYLEGALERGLLGASNSLDVEFSLMWANHDWVDVFPSRDPEAADSLVYQGGVTRAQFEDFGRYVIDSYFSRPNYTRIDGRPRFSIYEAGTLIKSLGGLDSTRDALEWLDREAQAAGHPGVHIDLIVWSFAVLPSEVAIDDASALIDALGGRSASSYVWIHHLEHDAGALDLPDEWSVVGDRAFQAYDDYRQDLRVPFHPNVTVGWDSSPRCDPSRPLAEGRYPWYRTWAPSVEGFRHGLELAKQFSESSSESYTEVTINAWNEWTEGSYLLPDTVTGLRYLEAVREVFGATLADRATSSAAEEASA